MENGLMTYNTGKVKKAGTTVKLCTKEISIRVKKLVKVDSNGKMVASMKEIL